MVLHYRPIHDAIEVNSLEIVKFLVENGADISAEREGKTLIDIAVAHGFQDIADYLRGLYESNICARVCNKINLHTFLHMLSDKIA